jgi:hypothetical protein
MWSYTYKHGDRPLDGYTIQRAAGRGGFGEVYYAVSDAGREVALKAITGFEQIELRGIGHCMNLKSPHLVTIFDVRQNADGRWFVLMEYVSGLNLRELLDQSPAGLGTQKAAFFLREIAKGLSYLHDCGIVHRDLKPANIFFENGYVKIGDYGLSKAIEPTHHSGQTVTVGTVHYMAPEVGVGKYDRSIDIYALGALLYEMMTGMVPFVGASPSEILIKHLSAEADCSGIPEPFCTAIKKAMAKDPAHRFQTVQEMVEAVFGAEHVRNSVSQFSPTELSVVAGRIAARIAAVPAGPPASAGGLGASPPPASSVTSPTGLGSPPPLPQSADPGGAWAAGWVAGQALRGGRRIGQAVLGDEPTRAVAYAEPQPDTISFKQRIFLAILATVVVASAAILFSGPRHEELIWIHTALAIAGASAAIYVCARHWLPRPLPGTGWADRFALAACGTLGAVTLAFPVWVDSFEARTGLKAQFVALLLALAVANPRRWTNADRVGRINFGTVIGAGFIAFIAAAIFGGNAVLAIAVVGGTALAVQVLAPWDERAARSREIAGETDDDEEDVRPEYAPRAASGASGAAVSSNRNGSAASPRPQTIPYATPTRRSARGERPVPRPLLIGFFFATLLFLSIGLLLSAVAGVGHNSWNDFSELWAGAMVMYSIALFCFTRIRRRTYASWITYLVMPAFRCVCLSVFLACWAMLGLGQHGRSDEEGFAVAMVIFLMLWCISWMGPWFWRMAIPPAPPPLPAGGWQPAGAPAMPFGPAQPVRNDQPAPNAAPTQTASAVNTTAPTARTWDRQERRRQRRHARHLSRQVRRRARRGVFGGATAVSGSFMIFCGFLLALMVAVDVPQMLSYGVPNAEIARAVQFDFFGGKVSEWPQLLHSLMSFTCVVLFLCGIAAALVTRRRDGALHMLRALVGACLLGFSVIPFSSEFTWRQPWQRLSQIPEADRAGWPAVQVLLDCVRMPGAFFSLVLLVVSLVILAWPSGRAAEAAAAARSPEADEPEEVPA